MTQTVVGVFDTPEAARAAEEALVNRGIDRSAIHLSAHEGFYGGSDTGTTGGRERHEGFMGGIRNFFTGMFGDDDRSEDMQHYSEAVRRGSAVVSVDLPDDANVEEAREALAACGAVDIDERASQWRQQGWTGYNPEAQPYTPDEVARERSTVLPVIQEELEVGKRQVNKGSVRVYSRTVETPVHETVSLREEHATIERRPVDRPLTEADREAFQDKSIEVQEMAEKAVVNKTARVVEEVVVGKEASEHTETIDDTVRHTEVEVDRGDATMARDTDLGGRDRDFAAGTQMRDRGSMDVSRDSDFIAGSGSTGSSVGGMGTAGSMGSATGGGAGNIGTMGAGGAPSSLGTGTTGANLGGTDLGGQSSLGNNYEDYEPYYRQDFQTRYGTSGGAYDDYAPAYRYGHTLGSDSRYQGRDWDTIEPQVRRDWESQYPDSAWDRFKLAVRHGWERVTGSRRS